MPERLEATVRHVRFHNRETGFTVLIAQRDGTSEEVTIVGAFPLAEADEAVVAVGDWRDDRRYGRQFVAASLTPVLPTSRDGIQRYLGAGHVKGVGATLAARMLDRFGTDLLQVIDDNPQLLLEIPGIGRGTLARITESWNAQRGVRDLLVFLAQHGLGGARAFRIQQQYGARAVSVIRENPYRLAAEVRGVGFHTSDAIARSLGLDPRSPERALAGLRHVVAGVREHGDCGIAAEAAAMKTADLLDAPREIVDAAIVSAVRAGELVAEDLDGTVHLFPPSLHRAETRIAAALLARAASPPAWRRVKVEKAMALAAAEAGFTLDPEQQEAVRMVLRSRVSVITGGPGVGKTTLVNVVLAIFRSLDLDVALAAPTGRAAKRLSESTGAYAQTIHRLLETSADGSGFARNEDNPLEDDVVIVDEMSMTDVPLFDALLRAMPAEAALVLVGDADQLPSIGPGQVLHDAIASERIPTVRLTRIHRQAAESDIVVNAHRINRGKRPEFRRRGETTDLFLFRATTGEEAQQHVIDLVREKLPRRFGFKTQRDVQVLAPMRNGTAGVHALNATLQRVLNPPERHRTRIERPNQVVFLPNDKVMQTENNYDKSVFNGDVGVIAQIDAERQIFTVDYGADAIVDYTFEEAVGDPAAIERAVRTSRAGERVTRLGRLLAAGK